MNNDNKSVVDKDVTKEYFPEVTVKTTPTNCK